MFPGMGKHGKLGWYDVSLLFKVFFRSCSQESVSENNGPRFTCSSKNHTFHNVITIREWSQETAEYSTCMPTSRVVTCANGADSTSTPCGCPSYLVLDFFGWHGVEGCSNLCMFRPNEQPRIDHTIMLVSTKGCWYRGRKPWFLDVLESQTRKFVKRQLSISPEKWLMFNFKKSLDIVVRPLFSDQILPTSL